MAAAADISFDGWTLRPATGELTRGGETQRLTQQPLRILVELLEHPGEVVTRERLVELLWPKGVLDYDNGLNVAVRKLRVALGDDTETPRYVETLPRIGYRFIGRIDAPSTEPAPPPPPIPQPAPPTRPRRHWLAVGALTLVAVGSVLAVLLLREQAAPPTGANTTPQLVARRTTSVRAYEHYLQGIYNRSYRGADGTPYAIRDFEAAIEEDPEYAEAWAGLADGLTASAIGHRAPATELFKRARESALRAVELDPGIAESHTALGQVYMFYDRDYAQAEAEYTKARAANDKYARLWHHIGILRTFQGRGEEGLAAMRRARELEPMTLLYTSNYGLVLYHMRRFEDAIAHESALLKGTPRLDQARSVLIRSLVATGDLASAEANLAQRVHEYPNLSDAAFVYAHQGRRDAALAELAKVKEMSEKGFGVGYEIAVIHAALGDVPKGCEALELAWRDHSPFLGWMRLDPRMDPLREAPCFAEILGRFKQ